MEIYITERGDYYKVKIINDSPQYFVKESLERLIPKYMRKYKKSKGYWLVDVIEKNALEEWLKIQEGITATLAKKLRAEKPDKYEKHYATLFLCGEVPMVVVDAMYKTLREIYQHDAGKLKEIKKAYRKISS
jgi:hypothetical protein